MPIVGVVEHVLLIKVRPGTTQERQDEMLKQLNKLKSITGVLHLKAGAALTPWGDKSICRGFTHALHSRHQNRAALVAFALHPAQIYTMDMYVHPILISQNGLLALDWESRVEAYIDQVYQAKRIVLCKLKSDVDEGERSCLVSDITQASRGASFASGGLNFSPARCHGFNFGYLSFFRRKLELEEFCNRPDEVSALLKSGTSVEDHILIDYENELGKEPDDSPLAIINF